MLWLVPKSSESSSETKFVDLRWCSASVRFVTGGAVGTGRRVVVVVVLLMRVVPRLLVLLETTMGRGLVVLLGSSICGS